MKGFGGQHKSKKKSNNKSKPSQEKIINQAIQFHLNGNIQEATKCYQQIIKQGCKDHKIFSNYGTILKDLGKLKDAELLYRKAIEINPNFAIAHSNLGTIFKDIGKLKDAELSYRKAIEINPDYAEAHSNLGTILNEVGKLKDAEISYRKAIQLNPNFGVAYSNLGGILHDLGKLKEAELSTRKAIEINPHYAEAHSNLGTILSEVGKLQDAEISYRKAIQLNPNFANAYSNLGGILHDLGKSEEALDSYLKVIDINPTHSNIYPSITRFLRDSDSSILDKSKLKKILNILLEKNDLPHKELFNVFNFLYSKEIIDIIEKLDSDFSKIELLIHNKVIINALKKIIFCDLKLEKMLTKVRRNICYRISKNIETINHSELEFIIALGEQCFLNEYVYSFTEEENISIDKIIKKCRDGELSESNIAILSCYFPLYKLIDQIPSLKSFNSSNQSIKELKELQITEPLKEIKLSKKIRKLGKINDDISQKVKSQYEENPYPRWRHGNPSIKNKVPFNQSINYSIKPNSISQNIGNKKLKILVAGCGTGQHILDTQRYKNSQIIGIDLSLSSLAYSQRKIDELEIDNVELIQMDILEVGLLEEQFDIIESSGVLHHMNNPSKGLQALLGSLKDNGFLKLGLYSELARQNIIEARNYIASKKLQPSKDNIRDFRETVFSGNVKELNSLTKSLDFYTLSSCRDLCFHAQEHRFTINQLHKTLKFNKLDFLGFVLPKAIKSTYEQYFPEDKKQTNLQNWAKFEEKYPNTFRAMYQFWVSKNNLTTKSI
ncbi:tetratricopeptide repeat protein [Prochlorococcus marinus]|uniref:Translation elongation factor P n=1 Tax=Prochlorococcus marinus str. PAC1 TaxID=59924 RepID=A0A0A2C7R7_PROMR|nr:tetratricopeptide repeat protein [Prochlorococcus marinus]KGG20674.1 Translation elongation factor P [Prochlorococcus marinus str. PAC1]